jgi:hypothetical protein
MIGNLLCNLFINCAKGTTEHIEILKKGNDNSNFKNGSLQPQKC